VSRWRAEVNMKIVLRALLFPSPHVGEGAERTRSVSEAGEG
jgi:hypothetical protein